MKSLHCYKKKFYNFIFSLFFTFQLPLSYFCLFNTLICFLLYFLLNYKFFVALYLYFFFHFVSSKKEKQTIHFFLFVFVEVLNIFYLYFLHHTSMCFFVSFSFSYFTNIFMFCCCNCIVYGVGTNLVNARVYVCECVVEMET